MVNKKLTSENELHDMIYTHGVHYAKQKGSSDTKELMRKKNLFPHPILLTNYQNKRLMLLAVNIARSVKESVNDPMLAPYKPLLKL